MTTEATAGLPPIVNSRDVSPYATVYFDAPGSTVRRMVPSSSSVSGSAMNSSATFPPAPPFRYLFVWKTTGCSGRLA